MKTYIEHKGNSYVANLTEPIDLSISLGAVRCFYAPPVVQKPLVAGSFVGSIEAGAPVNFFDVELNPHGNGTHTECMGHISREHQSLNQHLKRFHFVAQVISLEPMLQANGDRVIQLDQLTKEVGENGPEALVIRTLPNSPTKLQQDYSGTNPPYVEEDGVKWMVEQSIRHLILDLPSIDKEQDGGALKGHKAFWSYPGTERLDCTITELAYVPATVADGLYLLNLQTIPLELDVSPSRPVLYRLEVVE